MTDIGVFHHIDKSFKGNIHIYCFLGLHEKYRKISKKCIFKSTDFDKKQFFIHKSSENIFFYFFAWYYAVKTCPPPNSFEISLKCSKSKEICHKNHFLDFPNVPGFAHMY